MSTVATTALPPDPYRIVNGRLVRHQTDICDVAYLDDRHQVLVLDMMNIAYQRGHVDGAQEMLNKFRGGK